MNERFTAGPKEALRKRQDINGARYGARKDGNKSLQFRKGQDTPAPHIPQIAKEPAKELLGFLWR